MQIAQHCLHHGNCLGVLSQLLGDFSQDLGDFSKIWATFHKYWALFRISYVITLLRGNHISVNCMSIFHSGGRVLGMGMETERERGRGVKCEGKNFFGSK